MNWCLLFLWQAFLPISGTMTGRILTVENISALEGTSATLQCHLLYTAAEITQVSWKRNGHLLALHDSIYGSVIDPAFRKKVTLAPAYGITLLSLNASDTGEYLCDFYTFPDGIYKGKIFLEVTLPSLPEDSEADALDSSHSRISFGIMVSVIIISAATVIMLVILGAMRKTFRINSANCHQMGRSPSKQNELRSASLGSCLPTEAIPMTINQIYELENGIEESRTYFNIIGYRSLNSFNFSVETSLEGVKKKKAPK